MKGCVINESAGKFTTMASADRACQGLGPDKCAGIADMGCNGVGGETRPYQLCAKKALVPMKNKTNTEWLPIIDQFGRTQIDHGQPLNKRYPTIIDHCTYLSGAYGEWEFKNATGCSTKCGLGFGQGKGPGGVVCSSKFCLGVEPTMTSKDMRWCPATKACGKFTFTELLSITTNET